MKIRTLISFIIFAMFFISCEKKMDWINPNDSNADSAKIEKTCKENKIECGVVNVSIDGSLGELDCGKCDEGFNCNDENKCEKTDSDDTVSDNDDEKPLSDDEDSGDYVQDEDTACTEGSFKCHSMFVSHICEDGYWQLYEECVNGNVCNDENGQCGEETPCSFNPCNEREHTTGKCTVVGIGYKCECEDAYSWNELECVNPCDPNNPCKNIQNATGKCLADQEGYTCECKQNYTWETSECKADTRTAQCEGLPENAVWNIASKIEQTWNGEVWEPSNNGSYNTNPSASECRFKCSIDYFWNDSKCVSPCEPNPCGDILNSNGECSVWSMTSYSCGCKTHYTWNNSSKICVADQKTANCSSKPENTVWNDGGENGKFVQTWDGEKWYPITYASEYSTTEGTCHYKCAAYYTEYELGRCVTDTCPNNMQCLGGYCLPQDLSSEQCVTDSDCREFGGNAICNAKAAGGICSGCNNASDCPGNTQCMESGTCALMCDSDNDCPYGECTSLGYCGQKHCSTDEDCFGGTVCIESENNIGICQRIACREYSGI